MAVDPTSFRDDFDAPALDESVWLPHYLPAWSSRAETRASFRLADSHLTLDLPPGVGAWCPADHDPPLRISGIQSGNFSGPIGSTAGQQPFVDGQTVKEEQPRFEGHLQTQGHLEIRCAMALSPRSMAAFWLVGFEDHPDRCGEICVTEVFGKDIDADGSVGVGMGLHRFRDPNLDEDFARPRLPIDVAARHTYSVDWDEDEATFTVDGEVARRCRRPPTYPMQMMLAVFDFPAWSDGTDDHLVPSITVDHVATTT